MEREFRSTTRYRLMSDLFRITNSALSAGEVERLAENASLEALMKAAAELRDVAHGDRVSYSRKIFIPLTQLCRDVCHYCTFAKAPARLPRAYLTIDEVLAVAKAGARRGCKEALFTLGDKPESRYRSARDQLREMGYRSTIEYLIDAARTVRDKAGLLPHVNPGVMLDHEVAALRAVSVSQGLMLENVSERLCQKGQVHFGSPDKLPASRLATLRRTGEQNVPTTTGLLIGIGETRREQIETLFAIRELHRRYGHIQEVIVQSFRAKFDTKMAQAPEPEIGDLLWTIALTRLVLGGEANIQAPPNLSGDHLEAIVGAGINDWGGVSAVTIDYVNPEAPWPELETLSERTGRAGKTLVERLAIYPEFFADRGKWLDSGLHAAALRLSDLVGYARTDNWVTGQSTELPPDLSARPQSLRNSGSEVSGVIAKALQREKLTEAEAVTLFKARGQDFWRVTEAADGLRKEIIGDTVTYVVTRNINYTNVCSYKCKFCAFSKGRLSENLRGKPYVIDNDEIGRRAIEAWDRGATEVCLQGGIHPRFSGKTYLDIVHAITAAAPEIHIHAFSPLEIWTGATSLELSVEAFLSELMEAGLGSLPGTAAEILDDSVRAQICPDKVSTAQWASIIETAHLLDLPTTSTIMFGHLDRPENWARHLARLREIQERTGGFTEFVPLPFVADESPIYLKGQARRGPTFRECVLMHAVARLVFGRLLPNIQVSWVKMGAKGAAVCLCAGANDLGGTLMNETITRSAGALHGEEMPPANMEKIICGVGRTPKQRTTLYGEVAETRRQASLKAGPLLPTVARPAAEYFREIPGG